MRHTPEAGAVCGNSARTDLRGGRGVNLRPYRNNKAGPTGSRTSVGRIATLSADNITLAAQNDINLSGAQLNTETGQTSLIASGDVVLQTVTTSHHCG